MNLITRVQLFFKKLKDKTVDKKKHTTKKNMYTRDIKLGVLHKLPIRSIVVGTKVVTREGIGNVKALKENNWVVVTYPFSRTVQIKKENIFQYFIEIHSRWEPNKTLHPLSYSDYEYIHPKDTEDNHETWFEGFITQKKYFKLIDEVIEQRKNLPLFYRKKAGISLLRQLEKNGDDLQITKGKLFIKLQKK